jgi:exodeoxyribonuclease VII small subunit
MTNNESQSYQAMLSQVETILGEISSPNLDLDELVKKVETGYNLIRQMRERLKDVKGKIEKLQVEHSDH